MSSPYDVQTRPAVQKPQWIKDPFGEWHNPRYPDQFDPANPPAKPGVTLSYNEDTNGAVLKLGNQMLMEFSFAELFALSEQSYEVLRDCQKENARLFQEKIAAIVADEDHFHLHGPHLAVMNDVA